MNIYQKLTKENLEDLHLEAEKYPATVSALMERLTEANNIYSLSLGDAWDLAKLTGCQQGGNLDVFKLTKRFS